MTNTSIFPDNALDIVQSAVITAIENLGFKIKDVVITFPKPTDDFISDSVILWNAKVEMMVAQKDSTVEIEGVSYDNMAPQWIRISSRLHFAPLEEDTIYKNIIHQAAIRSAAFTVLVAMRPDRNFIYRAIQDYQIYPESLFVAEAILLGESTMEESNDRLGKPMPTDKVISNITKFISEAAFPRLASIYNHLKRKGN